MIVAGVALAIYVINKWYLTTVAKLLHMDLDFVSWEQYIEMNKEAKRAVLRLDAATSEVSLAYMTGDFETAIRKAKEILSQDGLPPQFRNVLQSYLIRSVVLSQPELSREELGEMIGEHPTETAKRAAGKYASTEIQITAIIPIRSISTDAIVAFTLSLIFSLRSSFTLIL